MLAIDGLVVMYYKVFDSSRLELFDHVIFQPFYCKHYYQLLNIVFTPYSCTSVTCCPTVDQQCWRMHCRYLLVSVPFSLNLSQNVVYACIVHIMMMTTVCLITGG